MDGVKMSAARWGAAALAFSLALGTCPFALGQKWYSKLLPCQPPADPVIALAAEIDCLEKHLDTYGTIVPKQPDVWGQSRLMAHRDEYEKLMRCELVNFKFTLQGALNRSDQAYAATALALGAAASGSKPADLTSTSTFAVTQSLTTDPNDVIQRPTSITPSIPLGNFQNASAGITIEPTVFLEQKSRYLSYLQELRRINEGDDTADSPGYSLNIMRVPVSVFAGKHTQEGYGAEITMTVTPHMSPELLPTTFKSLLINDIVDLLSFPLQNLLSDQNTLNVAQGLLRPASSQNGAESLDSSHHQKFGNIQPAAFAIGPYRTQVADTVESRGQAMPQRIDDLITAVDEATQGSQRAAAAAEGVSAYYIDKNIASKLHFVAARSGERRYPFPPRCLADVIGAPEIINLVNDMKPTITATFYNTDTYVHLGDVQSILQIELAAAYELLKLPQSQILWQQHCTEHLASMVNALQLDVIADLRERFEADLHAIAPNVKDRITETLAWTIIVESAVLNQALIDDMLKTRNTKGCPCVENQWMAFFEPRPTPEACEAFNSYVMCRWPIHVFALDPVTQDQNIADIYARRRESQLALAVAFASGQINAQQMTRMVRRLDTEIETIALNRTAVSFAHGSDTFGWRFYPRFQSPPIESNLTVFTRDLILGGPTTKQDMKKRRLEDGMRECTAIIVMSSFVPFMTVETRANWFRLTNPRRSELTLEQCMELSRCYKHVQHVAFETPLCEDYRHDDVLRLKRTVLQLDRKLPLQTALVPVPYENTIGGFQMFSSGVTDLAPELIGWYGAPGIKVSDSSSSASPAATPPASTATSSCACSAAAPAAASIGTPATFVSAPSAAAPSATATPQAASAPAASATPSAKTPAATAPAGGGATGGGATGGGNTGGGNAGGGNTGGGSAGASPTPTTTDDCAASCTCAVLAARTPGAGTTIFLVGKHFSVNSTLVIAGGQAISDVRMISRQEMQVTIPPGVNVVTKNGEDRVIVHVATPYGVTSSLDIPTVAKPAAPPKSAGIAWVSPPALAGYIEYNQIGDGVSAIEIGDVLGSLKIQDNGSLARQDHTHGQLFIRLVALAGAQHDTQIPLGVTRGIEVGFDQNGEASLPFAEIKDQIQEQIRRFLRKSDKVTTIVGQATVSFDAINMIRRAANPGQTASLVTFDNNLKINLQTISPQPVNILPSPDAATWRQPFQPNATAPRVARAGESRLPTQARVATPNAGGAAQFGPPAGRSGSAPARAQVERMPAVVR